MSREPLTDARSSEFIAVCLAGARDHERQARALRALAAKIFTPPLGTRVEFSGTSVQFITPVDDEPRL